MKALLLAAGKGTRLRPLTLETPKCLVPVLGRPLLGYWLDMLINGGIFPVLVNLHYLGRQVEDYLAVGPHRSAVHIVHEEILLGTGGTLLRNRDFFKREPMMLIHADNLSIFNLEQFILAHKQRPACCDMTMMTFESSTPESCGIVELSSKGVVTGFHEKVEHPPGKLANGAIYILEPSVVDYMASLGKVFIDFSTDVLPAFIGRIFTFHNSVYHRDIGTPESLAQAEMEFCSFQEQFAKLPGSAKLFDKCFHYISRSTVV